MQHDLAPTLAGSFLEGSDNAHNLKAGFCLGPAGVGGEDSPRMVATAAVTPRPNTGARDILNKTGKSRGLWLLGVVFRK